MKKTEIMVYVLVLVLCLPMMAGAKEDRGVKRAKSGENQDGEKRLALVIGNGAYPVSPLKNPPMMQRIWGTHSNPWGLR